MSDAVEPAAQRIAQRGREALLERLRPAFRQAVESRGPAERIDPPQLEQMVQAAADRADAVLWRRALAAAAMKELGIGLAEAVEHPAVRRAHEILAVPEYRPEPTLVPDQTLGAAPSPAPTVPDAIRLAAVHLGGIDALPAGARNLELRFSDAGLDVVNTIDGERIGRLTWEDIVTVDLPRHRRSLRQRSRQSPGIVVRTRRGQASFELPGLTEEQVREHLAPVLERARGAQSPEHPTPDEPG